MVWILQGYYLNFHTVYFIYLLFTLDYLEINLDNYSNRGNVKTFDKLFELLESH